MQFEERICDNYAKKTIDIIKDVPKNDMCPIVQQSVKNIIRNENYIYFEIDSRIISSDGGNFLGDLMEINIKGKTKQGAKEDHIFAKHIIPEEGILKGMLHIDVCYAKEFFMYTQLRTTYDELYTEFNISECDRLRKVKCYDCNSHVILMENLSRKGFKVLNRMDVVPLNFTEDAIKQIAMFHALSFVLEHTRPEYFEKEIKNFRSAYTIDDGEEFLNNWKSLIVNMVDDTFKYISDDKKDKRDIVAEKVLDKFPKYLTGKLGQVRCICHMDLRLNNILMRENIHQEVETVLIDYQLIGYNTPVLDILYLLYTSTDRQFRNKHMEYLKDLYYRTLQNHALLFDLDIETKFPRSLFEKEFNECLDFGLMVATYVLPFILTDDPDILKNNLNLNNTKINKVCNDRINEILEEYINLGIL